MKRKLSLLLVVVLLLSIFPLSAVAAGEDAVFTITPSVSQIATSPTDTEITYTVSLHVNDPGNLGGIQFRLSPPASIELSETEWTVVEFAGNATLPATSAEYYNPATKLFAVAFMDDGTAEKDIDLLTIKAKVKAGTPAGNLTVALVDYTTGGLDGLDFTNIGAVANPITVVDGITGDLAVDIVKPVKGAAPQSTITETAQYTGTIAWEGSPATFVPNTVYTAKVDLTAKSGYQFANSVNPTVASADSITEKNVSSDGNTLTFKATFPATADKDTPTITTPPTASDIDYGHTLADSALSGGAAEFGGVPVAGTFAWETPSIAPAVADSGTMGYPVTFTPNDTAAYASATCTVTLTVNPKDVTATQSQQNQNVVLNVGDFTQPTLDDSSITVDAPTYSYDGATSYNDIRDKLAALSAGTTGEIEYAFTANGNYTGTITGKIYFTIVNLPAATVVTPPESKTDLVYNGTEQVLVTEGAANHGTMQYKLGSGGAWSDEVPKAKDAGTYTVYYKAVGDGITYSDSAEGNVSVSIGQKDVTVGAGTYKVSKVYDGTTSAGTASGALAVSGILPTDSGVTVTPTIGAYSNADVGTGNVNVSLSISGDTNNNYQLGAVSVSVPCEITQATLTVDGTASATADYGTALKDIPITGLTAKLNGSNVAGSWAFSGETILDAGNTTAYTATFTPSTGVDNYNTLTSSIVPTINKIAYTGSAITATKNVLTNTAVNGVEVDMTSLLTSIKGAAVSAASENSDADNIISNVSKDGNKVKFDVASIAAKDKNATINVTISSTNYTDITATITVTTVDKAEASVSISGAPTSKTYGDADFNLTASVTNPGTGTGVWTWTSSEPTVLQVTGSSAAATVKVLKAGSATITAKYESDTTMGEQTTAPITVSKRVITVTADNKSMTVNGTLPTFTVTYGNLPSGVQAEDIFGTLASASTTTDGKTTGSFDITVTTPVLKTEAGANYEVGAVTKGTLTVNPRSSSGGGGGGSYTPSYSITVDKTENGTITVSPKSASKGDTVTITVKPDKGYELEMLKALDKDGDALKLTEKNGKYTFKMPSGKVTVKGSFVEEAPVQIFKDVPTDAYYYEAVKWAAEKGITGGVGNDLFAPNQPCTRAQIVTFLWRAAGSPAPKSSENPFTDVKAGSYYYDAVLWAVENGITNGTSATAFSPNATCSRAQIVTFLWRSQKSPAADTVNPFTDVAADSYYANAVVWAAENGITGGTSATTFSPNNNCTRAQIVTFIYRYMEK